MTQKYQLMGNSPINLKKSNAFQVAAKLSRRYGHIALFVVSNAYLLKIIETKGR